MSLVPGRGWYWRGRRRWWGGGGWRKRWRWQSREGQTYCLERWKWREKTTNLHCRFVENTLVWRAYGKHGIWEVEPESELLWFTWMCSAVLVKHTNISTDSSLWWALQMNIWKIIYLNCRERYEFIIDHRSYTHNSAVVRLKPEKSTDLNRIWTHDLCDTSAVLCQLSHQAIWAWTGFELMTSAIPVQCPVPFEPSSHLGAEYIFIGIFYLLWVHYELTKWPAPKWLDSSSVCE